MQTARVLAAVFFSFTTVAVYARETRTATFQPDQPVSGQTTLEIVLDTEVRNLYNKVQIIQSYSRLIRDWSELRVDRICRGQYTYSIFAVRHAKTWIRTETALLGIYTKS